MSSEPEPLPVAPNAESSANGHGQPVAGLSPFEHEVVAIFVDLLQLLGMPKSYGEIYGLLFASSVPLSFADIQEKLGISKGSVSQGLRALRELGAIRVATPEDLTEPDDRGQTTDDGRQTADSGAQKLPSTVYPLPSGSSGARRDYFVPVVELRELIRAFLKGSIEPQLAESKATLAKAGQLLSHHPLPEEQRLRLFRRLEKLQTWHSRAEGLLPWAVRFLG